MEVMNTSTTTDPTFYYNYLNSLVLNPTILIIIVLVIAVVVIFSSSSSSLGGEMGSSSSENSIFGIVIVVILVILILINAFQYFFSINVTAYIKGLFQPVTELDIVVNENTQQQPEPIQEIQFRKQVFNIPGNYYNYENAKALCKAYGGDLASYEQVEDSYNSGGEWCNYGWSKGQMALFPTQQTSYDVLQKIPGHEHDCGRPGINGGYIANPNVKFGVNCYGNKPRITPQEDELMQTMPRYPQNMQDVVFDERVDYWKNQISNILVSPFNHDTWTQI
jgi:hypothetical protein